MPFNKGDFTQQGVAGHVNANLRLNEKRLVNIDLTSNEEAEGCTIAGTVTDLLNDKVYGIGAGVSGNIEITENGENINVAQYATATVNVAGGDTKVIVPEQTVDAPRTGRVAIEGVDVSGLTVGDRLAVKLEGEAYGQQISNYTDAVFLHTNYDIISRAIPMDMNGATVTINIMIKDHDAGDQWGLSIYIGGVQTAFPGVTISARAW